MKQFTVKSKNFLSPFIWIILTCITLKSATAQWIPPIYFNSLSEYDTLFKESRPNDRISLIAPGHLAVQGNRMGLAVFDTSASGGYGGFGGTTGNDRENAFRDVILSSWISCSSQGDVSFRAGYLLRLDENEANGYLIQVTSWQTRAVTFAIYENSGLSQAGDPIFTQTVSLSTIELASDTWYAFKVRADGGTFSLDFANGEATASFTDKTVSATEGQIGIMLASPNLYTTVNLDTFSVIEAISDGSHTPSETRLTSSDVKENDRRVSQVGHFDSLDPDFTQTTFSYSLVSGSGDNGNDFFTIEDNTLWTAKSFNYEAGSSYSIRISTTDPSNIYREDIFIINILDLFESPHRILDFYSVEPNHYILEWPLDAGYSYQVQQSATLLTESWTDVRDPVVAEDGESLVSFHLRPEEKDAKLFFRVLRSEIP